MRDVLEPDDPAVIAGLKDLRKQRHRVLFLFLGAIPVFLPLFWLQLPLWLLAPLVIAWFLTWCGTIWQYTFASCPACRQFVRIGGFAGNAFTRRCVNCGLSLLL